MIRNHCGQESTGMGLVLDDEFSEEEVHMAVKQLKEDKSTGDGWTKRMVTEISNVFIPIILMLFNIILSLSVSIFMENFNRK